jgi:mannosyltransferase
MTVVAVVVLLLIAFALRLYKLNTGFWLDEIITVGEFARRDWLAIITQIPIPNNHLLYTLLTKLSVNLFGETEWSARLPAMVLGALTPAVSYLLFRKFYSESASFCAGLFMALNCWAVWFSQDARGYSGLILFGLLETWFFLNHIETKKPASALAYVFCAGIAVWFHLYGGFLIAAQLCWGLLLAAAKKARAAPLLLTVAAGLFALSLYLPASAQLYRYGIGPARETAPILSLGLFKELLLMISGGNYLAAGSIFALLVLTGFFGVWKKQPGFVFIYLASAILLTAFSAFAKVFIVARFLFYPLPLFMLSLALGLEKIAGLPRQKSLRIALTLILPALVCIAMIPGLKNYYRLGKQGYRDAATYIKQKHPGQQVIAYGYAGKWFVYYYPAAVPTDKKDRLTPETIRGRLIISTRTDWQAYNIDVVNRYCRPEVYLPTAGPEDNTLVIFNCPNQ